jgi:hypothetical protein
MISRTQVSLKPPRDNSLMVEGISIGLMDTRILKFGSEIAAQGKKAQVRLQDQVTQIYEDLREDIFRYLVLIGVAPAEAQDVCQEVFLRLYSALVKGQRSTISVLGYSRLRTTAAFTRGPISPRWSSSTPQSSSGWSPSHRIRRRPCWTAKECCKCTARFHRARLLVRL